MRQASDRQTSIEKPDPNSTAATVASSSSFTDDARKAHWDRVTRTLIEVFGMTEDDAKGKVEEFDRNWKDRIKKASDAYTISEPDTSDVAELAVFHIDAFRLAADLAKPPQVESVEYDETVAKNTKWLT